MDKLAIEGGNPVSKKPFPSWPVMDESGVAVSWICPTDSFVAVWNREGNDFIASVINSHPGRFIGCAVSNPWFGKDAEKELIRAFKNGLRALFLHPHLQGFQLSDTLVDPLINVAKEFSVPIYAHTGTPVCSEPFQLSALARRHPDARFIMGHMGFADFWRDAVNIANIWLQPTCSPPIAIRAAKGAIGPERILFGSDGGFGTIGIINYGIAKYRLSLGDEILNRVLRDNPKILRRI